MQNLQITAALLSALTENKSFFDYEFMALVSDNTKMNNAMREFRINIWVSVIKSLVDTKFSFKNVLPTIGRVSTFHNTCL